MDSVSVGDCNPNQTCFCGKLLQAYPTKLPGWNCHSCCNLLDETTYYQCGTFQTCKHNYQICCSCFNTLPTDPNNYEKDLNLASTKVKSIMEIIS